MNILLKILLITVLLVIVIISPFLWLRLYLYYERTHVEKIDTSFFTYELREELINDIKEVTKDTNDNNINYIEIGKDKIEYYGLNHNILSQKNILWFKINEIIWELNITFLRIWLDSIWKIDHVYVSFSWKKYTYIYEVKKNNYSEWYVIPVWTWRVEKVIDENWYVFRLCDRVICQEPQE